MAVTASAPGKLVLLGDHAAVYQRPCLVTAVDVRYEVTMAPTDADRIEIQTPTMRAEKDVHRLTRGELGTFQRDETRFVEAALYRFFLQHPRDIGLQIRTDGPEMSYGLGSSSAVTVATLAALAEVTGVTLTPRDTFDMAYAAVLDVQGRGSGVDVAAAVYGGTLYYIRDQGVIEPLTLRTVPVVIGYSGGKVRTPGLLAHVAALHRRYPTHINALFDLMAGLVEDGRAALHAGDERTFGDMVDIHQGLLESLRVGSPALANLIFAAREAGAYGAKLSGAGGGDCMFAVVDGDRGPMVRQAIGATSNGSVVGYATHAPGVQVQAL